MCMGIWFCNPMDCSSVNGIFQARILEWVASPFSRGSSWSQGLNQGFLHCRQILYCLSHQGSCHCVVKPNLKIKKIKCTGNSLANPLIRILHFSWPGPGFSPWWVSKAIWCSQKKKKWIPHQASLLRWFPMFLNYEQDSDEQFCM